MSLRQLCKETSKRPSKVLLYFPQERTTGIAPSRLILGKSFEYNEGSMVSHYYYICMLRHGRLPAQDIVTMKVLYTCMPEEVILSHGHVKSTHICIMFSCTSSFVATFLPQNSIGKLKALRRKMFWIIQQLPHRKCILKSNCIK